MKFQHLVFALNLVLPPVVLAQTNSLAVEVSRGTYLYAPQASPAETNNNGHTAISWMSNQPDLTFMVHDTQRCPPKYAFSIFNTNLFSPAERSFLHKAWAKYKFANTNICESVRTDPGDGYDVGFFKEGTSVKFKVDPNLRGEDYALKAVAITNHSDWRLNVEQVEHGRLNGLRIEFYGDHGGCLLHFINDNAVGEWLDWDPSGNLRFHVKFNKPYPLFRFIALSK